MHFPILGIKSYSDQGILSTERLICTKEQKEFKKLIEYCCALSLTA